MRSPFEVPGGHGLGGEAGQASSGHECTHMFMCVHVCTRVRVTDSGPAEPCFQIQVPWVLWQLLPSTTPTPAGGALENEAKCSRYGRSRNSGAPGRCARRGTDSQVTSQPDRECKTGTWAQTFKAHTGHSTLGGPRGAAAPAPTCLCSRARLGWRLLAVLSWEEHGLLPYLPAPLPGTRDTAHAGTCSLALPARLGARWLREPAFWPWLTLTLTLPLPASLAEDTAGAGREGVCPGGSLWAIRAIPNNVPELETPACLPELSRGSVCCQAGGANGLGGCK